MTASLLNERFVAVNPSMVRTFGADRAIILQEIYFSTTGQLGSNGDAVEATQTEIADATGLSRDNVNRNLAKLEADGMVTATSTGGRTSKKTYAINVQTVEDACRPARELLARKRASVSAKSRKPLRGSAQTHIYIEKEEEEDVGGSDANPLTDPEYETWRKAARWVLDRWTSVNDRPQRKLTKKAVNDMRLLMTRGPTTWAEPAEISKREIVAVMEAAMADTFWSQQIQSPGNLRDHWDRLALLANPPSSSSSPGLTPDEAVTHLIDTYRTVGYQSWRHMLDALDNRPELKLVAEAIGQRAFQGDLKDLEFAIRSQVRARKNAAA